MLTWDSGNWAEKNVLKPEGEARKTSRRMFEDSLSSFTDMVSNQTTDKQTKNCSNRNKELVLDIKLQDTVPGSEIRERTKTNVIIEYILKQWQWAGRVAKNKDSRWTKRCTEWPPRSRGPPSRRWQDDKVKKEGTTWSRTVLDRQQGRALMRWMDNA